MAALCDQRAGGRDGEGGDSEGPANAAGPYASQGSRRRAMPAYRRAAWSSDHHSFDCNARRAPAAVTDWPCGGWERGDVRDCHLSNVFANELGSWEEVLRPGAWGFSDSHYESHRSLCHEPMPAAILTTVAARKNSIPMHMEEQNGRY
jgi:hypothetical protein